MAKHASHIEALLVSSSFDGEVLSREPMSRHTSYRIGGPARFFVRVDSIGALTGLLGCCRETDTPYFIAGRGTNLLVCDEGFDGIVVVLGRDFKNLSSDETGTISAGAAVMLSAVVQEALRKELTGLEFAVGTPGSLGGALRMNAGSKDEWIGSRVRNVTILTNEGLLEKIPGAGIEWGYRETSFLPNTTILECELVLEKGDPFFIQGKMEGNLARRKKTQPLSEPSCGSVFKNPPGSSAAKLIDDLGLKGRSCGGAKISEKHANFIVNVGGATAKDVLTLIELIKKEVKEAYGIELETEVKLLGF